MDISRKKLLAFDLDGTLSQHKTPISDENRQMLSALSEKYKLLMLGAGACRRIYDQLRQFPIDIVGCYGVQQSTIIDGKFTLLRDEKMTTDREFFDAVAKQLRPKLGIENYYGKSMEYHETGLVTLPILGTDAPLSEKLAYDPDRSKRSAMFPVVKEAMPGYNVFIGGSSSFDISTGVYNKYYALKRYCDENGFDIEDALFIGDDFGDGGNDSPIRLNGVDYIEIDDYEKFPEKTAFLLNK